MIQNDLCAQIGRFPDLQRFSAYRSNKKSMQMNSPHGFHVVYGGDKRDRTADLLNAIQTLSQLSYTPKLQFIIQGKQKLCQVCRGEKHMFFMIFMESFRKAI